MLQKTSLLTGQGCNDMNQKKAHNISQKHGKETQVYSFLLRFLFMLFFVSGFADLGRIWICIVEKGLIQIGRWKKDWLRIQFEQSGPLKLNLSINKYWLNKVVMKYKHISDIDYYIERKKITVNLLGRIWFRISFTVGSGFFIFQGSNPDPGQLHSDP